MKRPGLKSSLVLLFALGLLAAPAVPGRAAVTDDEAKVLGLRGR